MAKLGPLHMPYPKGLPKMHTFNSFMERSTRPPTIGLTQGGSSRKGAAARVAATDGRARPIPLTLPKEDE